MKQDIIILWSSNKPVIGIPHCYRCYLWIFAGKRRQIFYRKREKRVSTQFI